MASGQRQSGASGPRTATGYFQVKVMLADCSAAPSQATVIVYVPACALSPQMIHGDQPSEPTANTFDVTGLFGVGGGPGDVPGT